MPRFVVHEHHATHLHWDFRLEYAGVLIGIRPGLLTNCFYARRSLERAVKWLYANDSYLKQPYADNLAVHSDKPISRDDSLHTLKELFQTCATRCQY